MQEGLAGLGTIVWLFGVLIVILWIALPFAVFGIKKRLDEIIKQLRILNRQGGRE